MIYNKRSATTLPLRCVLLSSFATYTIGDTIVWLQPVIVHGFVAQKGLTGMQAGLLASLEMITLATVMMLASRLSASLPLLKTILCGVVMLAVASVGSMLCDKWSILVVLRFMSGVGFGIMLLVPTMAIAGLKEPQPIYARMYSISLICGATLLAVLPLAGSALGRAPAFPLLLCYIVLLLPLVLLMPRDRRSAARVDTGAAAPGGLPRSGILLLAAGLSLLTLSNSSVWAFFIEIAAKASLSADAANRAVSLCLLAALLGSLIATFALRRVGRMLSMLVGAVGMSTGLCLMIFGAEPTLFRVGGCLTWFSLYLLMPSVLGTAAAVDPSGRGAAFILGSVVLVGASGPYLGGVIIKAAGISSLGKVALAAMIVSVTLFTLSQRTATTVATRPVEQ